MMKVLRVNTGTAQEVTIGQRRVLTGTVSADDPIERLPSPRQVNLRELFKSCAKA